MTIKLLLKTFFLIIILFFLVLMGMSNRSDVKFSLPPLLPKSVTMPAAIMYISFFAIGLISGAILTVGGKKGATSKPAKTDK